MVFVCASLGACTAPADPPPPQDDDDSSEEPSGSDPCAEPDEAVVLGSTVELQTPKDVEALQGVTELTGSLALFGSSVQAFELPQLRRIHGSFLVDLNDSLVEFDLPCLLQVGETVHVGDNGALERFGAPRLQSVDGPVEIANNNYTMEDVDLSSLRSVGGELHLWNNDALLNLDFPALQEVEGDLTDRNLPVGTDDPLLSIQLPQLESIGGSFLLEYLSVLSEVDAPALARVSGDFTVQQNPALPQCLAESWVSQLDAAEGIQGAVSIEGNRLDCTCQGEPPTVTADCD